MKSRTLKREDVSAQIGLSVVVLNAAREFDEPEGPFVGVPRLEELAAAAAITRCQMAPRLRGIELKNIRKILALSQQGLAETLGGETASMTVSRWETETTAMGDYAEKLVRLLACERLKGTAPGAAYDPLTVIGLKLTDRKAKMAPMEFRRTRTKIGRSIEEAWSTAEAAEGKAAA